MKTLAKETLQIVRQNLRNILLFEFLYRLIVYSAYLRFAKRGLRLALKMAGYSYLTVSNIGRFLIQPWTIVLILLLGSIGIALLMLEAAGLITAYQGSAYGQKLSPLHILWGGLQKVLEEIRRKNVKLCGVLPVQYFLLNLFLIFRILTHLKPMNFVLLEMLRSPWAMGSLAVLGFVCILIAIPTMFVFYGCMIEQKSFSDSLVRSLSLLKHHIFRSAGLLVAGNILVIILLVVVYTFSVFVAAVFIVKFTEQNLAIAVLLSVSDQLELLFIFLGGILMAVVNFGALSVLYYQYGNQRYRQSRWDFSYPAKGSVDRKWIGAALGLIMSLSLFYIFDLVYNGSSLANTILIETQITAHRGSSGTAPENTMAAMEAAIAEMADFAEIDVQLTSDGVVVLGHDANLKRVAGLNRSIGSMTWEEVSQIDVGSWFSREYADTRIPTLEEVLAGCKGKINLNVEMKNIGKDSILPEKVVELILAHGMEEQCVITSASQLYLQQVKELAPQLRTGYIISAAYGDFYSSDAVDFISIRSNFVNESLVKSVHVQGKAVHAWTVNSKSEMERLCMLGVDNVITDYPVLAREVIYREGAKETLLEYLKLAYR